MEAIIQRLSDLGKACSFTQEEKAEIERMYTDILDKTFVKTSCNDCYKDAVYEMYAYLKKNGKMRDKTIYKLKNGTLLQMEFGSGEFYTNANLTDEVAEKYLAKYPERINYFAIFPDDWQKRIKSKNKKKKK